jgi:predicted hotdog family 3-hydroxylacyl-ACP dehydratase
MNQSPLFESIKDIVPHRSPMLLLESVVSWHKSGIEVLVNPQDSVLFADTDGTIPAWVGIEYMAQAISAFAGINAKQKSEAICLGFLLGTRQYSAYVKHFLPSEKLQVRMEELMRDETNLVLFSGEIYANNTLLARAEIKAIQPKNIDIIVEQFKRMGAAVESSNDRS